MRATAKKERPGSRVGVSLDAIDIELAASFIDRHDIADVVVIDAAPSVPPGWPSEKP